MDLELISTALCPFVQSSVVTLRLNGVPYRLTVIDITNPPPWFDDVSPLGRVPILRIDDDHIVFESTVINEYLNDVTSGSLLPEEPLQRAAHRATIAYGTAILADLSRIVTAVDETEFDDAAYDLDEKLDYLEDKKSDAVFFDGSEPSLVDACYAPLFARLDILKPARKLLNTSDHPKLAAWSGTVLQLGAVKQTIDAEFTALYRDSAKQRDGWLGQQL
jgi:glutathione S-transferase